MNGSFVEEVEDWEEDPHTPNDIDVVTFYYPSDAEEWKVLPLFYPEETKSKFHVDARGIRPGKTAERRNRVRYCVLLWAVVAQAKGTGHGRHSSMLT